MSLYLKPIGELPELEAPQNADRYEVETLIAGEPKSRKESRMAMQSAAASAGPVKNLVDAARAVAESKALSVSVNQGTPHFPDAAKNVDLTLTGQNLPYQSGDPANIKETVDALRLYAEGVDAAFTAAWPEAVKKPSVPRGTSGSTVDRRTLMQSLDMKSRNPTTLTLESRSADIEDDDGAVLIETLLTLPAADQAAAGLMPAAAYNQLETNTADIAALKGANKRVPTQEPLPEGLAQEAVLDIWNAATGNKVLTEGDTLISFHPLSMNHAWTWFGSDQLWHFRGVDAAGPADLDALGMVKGSLEAGQVFVEADGTMSLNGYDGLTNGIAENAAAIGQRALKQSGAAPGNLAVLDDEGGYADSNLAPEDLAAKVTDFAPGNLAMLDAEGGFADAGIGPDDLISKVAGATDGNLAMLDADGKLKDSGKNADEVGKVETVDGVEAGTGKNVALHREVTLGELQNLYEHPEQAVPGAIYAISDNQTALDLVQAAKDYVDETLALGDRDHYDPDMGIYWPNWDPEKTYHPGDGANRHYRGFTAKTENTNSEPYAGSPDWDFEPEDYVINGSYEAYGAGGGASGGRGIFVTQGYGFYCTENTALTQAKYDAVLAFIAALPWPVPAWPVTGEGIPGAAEWRILYGWPDNGRFQLSFYPGGVLRWVDPRAQLGLKETLDPAGNDPVMAKGIAAWVREFVYPVGVITAFANATDPNVNFAPQAWEKLPDQTFLRNVTGAPGGTGGSNTVSQVIAHTHALGAITVPSAGAHAHPVQTRNWSEGNGGICKSNGGGAGAVNTDSAGAHAHTIPAGTAVPAPAGAVTSVNNQPAYIDAVFWKRTA